MRSSLAWFTVASTSSLLAIVGCGSNSSTAASCGAKPICGGTPTGSWRVTSTCVEGDIDGDISAALIGSSIMPADCKDLFQSIAFDIQGTATFANNQETDNATRTTSATAVYTPTCLSALGKKPITVTQSVCMTVQGSLLPDYDSVSCSFTGGNCVCKLSKRKAVPTAPQAYTTSGGTITYADPSVVPASYCVDHSTLTLRQGMLPSSAYVVTVLDKI